MFFEFHANCCAVKSQVTNEVLLQGTVGPDGSYTFPNIQFHSSSTGVASYCLSSAVYSVNPATSKVNYPLDTCNKIDNSLVTPCNGSNSVWHDRLGHPNSHVLQLVLKHCFLCQQKYACII